MAHRLEVELTSSREDGTWTWRAAGAKQPKGELTSSLLYEGAAVGDVVRIEAEKHIDGFEVTQVFAPKQKEARNDLLELKRREFRDDELVSEVRASRGGRGGSGGDRKGGRGDRKGGRDGDRKGGRGERPSGPRSGGGDRRPRAASEAEQRPKAKRLRAGNQHRQAILAEVPEEFRPIAEQVSRGGMPAVRTAIEKQNADAVAAGTPPINADPIISIAEGLVPKLRTAEWRDRADAALKDLEELDLRDLRSVMGAAESAGRDDESRALVDQLRAGLNERIEKDHQQWLADLTEAMGQGRTVRALRLSSRPVKPGAPLPTELASQMSEAASQALAEDVAQDRWATVLDAVAFSPIRNAVVPHGKPAEPGKDLLDAVRRVADRVPAIAALFSIDPSEATKRRRPRRGKPGKQGDAAKKGDTKAKKGPKPKPEPKAAEAAPADATAAGAPAPDAPAPDAPAPDAPAPDAPAPDAIEAASKPDAIEAAPKPDAIEAAPKPDAIEAAPAPDAIEAAPAPDAIEAAPKPETVEAAPAADASEAAPSGDAEPAS